MCSLDADCYEGQICYQGSCYWNNNPSGSPCNGNLCSGQQPVCVPAADTSIFPPYGCLGCAADSDCVQCFYGYLPTNTEYKTLTGTAKKVDSKACDQPSATILAVQSDATTLSISWSPDCERSLYVENLSVQGQTISGQAFLYTSKPENANVVARTNVANGTEIKIDLDLGSPYTLKDLTPGLWRLSFFANDDGILYASSPIIETLAVSFVELLGKLLRVARLSESRLFCYISRTLEYDLRVSAVPG